jgi:hypothetical protein
LRKEAAKSIPKKERAFLDEDPSEERYDEEAVNESNQSEQEIINAELSMVQKIYICHLRILE